MALLPRIETPEQYRESPRDEATYLAPAREICARHGLEDERLTKYAGGSTIVFAVADTHVIKLFEPIFTAAFRTEATALAFVEGKLGIPTPGVVATGELEGWRYVVMEQLAGVSLVEAWDDMVDGERRSICARVGAAVARQHALPIEGLKLPGPGWTDFLAGQAERCVAHRRAAGAPEHWVAQIPEFLGSVRLDDPARVLLHTELMREHVLVRRAEAGWEVSGVLDYEPAMVGAPEYEFASAGFFLCCGRPELFRAFLLAYGLPESELTPELARRILAYALLHRYSNLRWYLDVLPPRDATTLDELAGEWYSLHRASGRSRDPCDTH